MDKHSPDKAKNIKTLIHQKNLPDLVPQQFAAKITAVVFAEGTELKNTIHNK